MKQPWHFPPPVTSKHPEAGPLNDTRWIQKLDGANGHKITTSRVPPLSTWDRMSAQQDLMESWLSAVEHAVEGSSNPQREMLKSLQEMNETLWQILIPPPPPIQTASDVQLNGYAWRMHWVEAMLQGLTVGLESNRRGMDSINQKLVDWQPIGHDGPLVKESLVLHPIVNLDMFIHQEAMESGQEVSRVWRSSHKDCKRLWTRLYHNRLRLDQWSQSHQSSRQSGTSPYIFIYIKRPVKTSLNQS